MITRALAPRRVVPLLALALAGAAAATASAAAPVNGSIFGEVLSTKGGTFVMSSTQVTGGKATVSVGAKTTISEQATAERSELKRGVCVLANGQAAKSGTVTAVRIALSSPVKGQCTGGFDRRPGGARPTGQRRPPNGTPPPNRNRPANLGFAFGAVTAVKGSTLTVKGPRGTTKVVLTKTTRLSKAIHVESSAIHTKMCAFVRGTSTDKGLTVTAQDIALTPKPANGCTFRFGRRPGG